MEPNVTNDPRFPIGKFKYQGPPDKSQREDLINEIERVPEALRSTVTGLSSSQLDTPYRDGGWTVLQVIHHLSDSHMNAYIRFKFALTEDEPLINAYEEDLWAKLPDNKSTPAEVSLALLESLHRRWVGLLRSMNPEEWKRAFRHPQYGPMPLEKNLALYAWHGKHHVAHITELKKKMGWS